MKIIYQLFMCSMIIFSLSNLAQAQDTPVDCSANNKCPTGTECQLGLCIPIEAGGQKPVTTSD